MICNKCGATIEEHESACSYCGNTIYNRAEKEFFNDLEDIRQDVEDLEFIPQNTTKNSIKGIVKSVLVIFIILGILLLINYIHVRRTLG